MTADQFFQQLLEQALWHETHKPEPAPWKGKVLERLITNKVWSEVRRKKESETDVRAEVI